jgi:hypothetical protein
MAVLALAFGCGEVSAPEDTKVSSAELAGKAKKNEDPKCRKLRGKLILIPEAAGTCTISQTVTGPTYVGNPDPYGNPSCFSFTIRGTMRGTGFAGLTSEPMQFGATASPAVMAEWPVPAAALTRQVLTARAVINLKGGQVFTRDVIMIDLASGTTTEQLIATGGTGKWKDATGYAHVLGSSIGQEVPIVGQFCRP